MEIAVDAPAAAQATAGTQVGSHGRPSILADADRQGDALVLRYGPAVLLLLLALIPALLAGQRSYLSYGTETDFLGSFVPEAERVLAGEPLVLAFHPPLYAAVIALAKSILGEWFAAGLVVSVVAAIGAAFATFCLVRGLLGTVVALGALAVLLGSPVFVRVAAEATSDMFCFALFAGCCALALAGIRSGSIASWRLLGLALGAALLTRTNAITLILLLAAPLFTDRPRSRQCQDIVQILASAAIPLTIWFAYAIASGSQPFPVGTHLNLAMTYFAEGPDRMSGDAFASVAGRFDGFLDVLLHDPAHLIRTYLRDFFHLLKTGIPELITFPFRLLAVAGLMLLVLLHGRESRLWLFALVFAAQIVLVNFKAFEARYYLFVLPAFGAGLGVVLEAMLRAELSTRVRRAAAACVLLVALVLGVADSVKSAYAELLSDRHEIAEAIPAARQVIEPGDVVVARKPHVAFYTGARPVSLLDTAELARLHEQLCAASGAGQVHLFYGKIERSRRAGLRAALLSDAPPAWLEIEAASQPPGEWVLFRFRGCAPRESSVRAGSE